MTASSPYCPVTAAQVRQSALDYLALGHIHKAGAFRAGATLCAWPGCPMGRGWDETGEKGVCIVTIGDTAEIRPVELDTVRFRELEVDIDGDAVAGLEAALPGNVDTAELKKRFSAFPNLELRDCSEAPVDLWAEVGEDTLRGVYFRLLRDAVENPENAGQVRLAAEISQKLLRGREVTLP